MLKIKNDFNTVKWWQFPMLIVAGIVNATGVALFLLPSGVLDGSRFSFLPFSNRALQ